MTIEINPEWININEYLCAREKKNDKCVDVIVKNNMK